MRLTKFHLDKISFRELKLHEVELADLETLNVRECTFFQGITFRRAT